MWTPISPKWIVSQNGEFLVAIAISERLYKCYEVVLPSIHPTARIMDKEQIRHIIPLEQEFNRIKNNTEIGKSILSDLNLIVLGWMMHLNNPLYEGTLPSRIKRVADTIKSPDYNIKKIIDQVNDVTVLLNQRRVLRNTTNGEICKDVEDVLEAVYAQLRYISKASEVPRSLKMFHDFTFGLNFHDRLQNQDWRIVVYLRTPESRVTQSHIYSFGPKNYGYTTVCFSHVYCENLYLVAEISAGKENCPYSRIACGILKLPTSFESKMDLRTPFGGHWSSFVNSLIKGEDSDRCALVSSIDISQGPISAPCVTPSFIIDGFQHYNALHLQTHGFITDTHQSSAYFLRFRLLGSYNISQTSSSLFYHNQTNDECFTFTNFESGDLIRVELWRGKTLVSVSNVEYEKRAFTIHFSSLTTFQSVGITKHIADLHCTAVYMGQSKIPDSILRIQNFRNYSEVHILAQLKAFIIEPSMVRYLEALGTSLLGVITFFDCPEVSEIAFIKLLLLLETANHFPYAMKCLLISKQSSSLKDVSYLSVVLRVIFNLLRSDEYNLLLIDKWNEIGELVEEITPNTLDCNSSNYEDVFAACSEMVLPPELHPETRQAPERLIQAPNTHEHSPISPTGSRNSASRHLDYLWRNRPLVEQIKDIVREMIAAYGRGPNNLKIKYLKVSNSFFGTFRKLLGDSVLILYVKFLECVDWSYDHLVINHYKLQILAQIPSEWPFDGINCLEFVDLCFSSIAPVWLNKASQPGRKWLELHATVSILHNLLKLLDPPKISTLASKVVPLLFNITGTLVCHLEENDQQLPNNDISDTECKKITLELIILLKVFLEFVPKPSILPPCTPHRKMMREVIIKAFNSCYKWVKFDTFDPTDYSSQLIQASTINATLRYVASILMKYFLPLPDAASSFESDLWYHLFYLLGKLSLFSNYLEPLDPFQDCAHSNLAAALNQQVNSSIEESWYGLQWAHSVPGDCSFLYGYHVSLFCCKNNVTSLFVELVFAGNKIAGPLLRNIVDTEWIISENLQELCLEVLEAVDDTFIALYENNFAPPSSCQCDAFISIFEDRCEPNYQRFVGTIRKYLKLLSDNYRYNSLLTVRRIIKFLKAKHAFPLLHKYLKLILKSEKNPRYIGLSLIELANLYHWDDNLELGALEYLSLPPQKTCQRRECLLKMATQHFIDSGSCLLAIETIQEREVHYKRVLDYHNLAVVSGQLAKLYHKVAIERIVPPNYYLVEFGNDFFGLSGERYIFEQPPYIRLDAFTKSIQEKYGQGPINIKTVEPQAHDFDDKAVVMPWLADTLKSHRANRFVSTTPLPHHGVVDMRVQLVVYEVEDRFPTTCCQSLVINSTRVELNSLQYAIQVVQARSQDLRTLCCRHSAYPHETKITVHLEMLLSSTLSSPINGGLSQYRELLSRDHDHKLSKAFQELKHAVQLALELFSQIIDETMLPQYAYFTRLFVDSF